MLFVILLGEEVALTISPDHGFWGIVATQVIIAACVLSIIVWVGTGLHRQRNLLRNGIAVAGQVTGVEDLNSGGRAYFLLRYQFRTQEGALCEEARYVALTTRDYYIRAGADSAITILYDAKNPRRNTPYAFVSLAELTA